jgi:RND family efflux transporter MFP subunit
MRIALPLITALALAACAGDEPAPSAAAETTAPVRVELPRAWTEPHVVRATGRIEASREAGLGFRTGGVIARIAVDIGDRVGAGDLLAELRSTDVDAALAAAREQRERARRDLARAEDLLARQLVAREQVDNARTALAVAEAALRDAEFTRRYTEIRAAAAGRVLARLAEPGEVIAAGQPILRIGETDGAWIARVALADRDALAIAPGTQARVAVRAAGLSDVAGTVSRIGGAAAAASAAIDAEISFTAPASGLVSGLVAEAEIAIPAAPVLTVPVSALLRAQAGRASVFVVTNGRAEAREIVTGQLRGDRIEVREGIAADVEIVVEGAAWLDPGQPVRVLR